MAGKALKNYKNRGMDNGRPNKSSPVWIIVIVLLLASVPLYLLSVGLAVWLYSRDVFTRNQIQTVYAPIGWLELRNPTFARVLRDYVNLWVSPPPQQPAATPAPS
jgi:hypothetical protein